MTFIKENFTDSQKKLKLDNMSISSTLALKQPANQSQLFHQLKNGTDNYTNKDPDNAVKCRYHDMEEIQTFKTPNKNKPLSFHINACSFSKKFDDLQSFS